MKKFLGLLTTVAVFGFLIAYVPNSYAEKPPKTPNNENSHEKATGNILVAERDWSLEFDAHETDPVKGEIRTWSNTVNREILLHVEAVRVEGPYAWFAAEAYADTAGSNVGKWLFVKVYDGGTPGTNGDLSWWDWNSGTDGDTAKLRVENMELPSNPHEILSGNVVVHYNQPWLIDSVDVPGTNNVGIDSNVVLESGKNYLLKASGTYRFANWGEYGVADAEYAYRDDSFSEPIPPDNWTLGENTYPSVLGLDVQVNGIDVYWGDYSTEHEYTHPYTGNDSVVHFNIYDSSYYDNSGSIHVDIYEIP